MAIGHNSRRRPARRAFQPSIDGRLETRVLLSQMSAIRSQTAAGGQAVVITTPTNQQFFISVTQGTIQATPASGGRVNLIANGTTSQTLLEINEIIPMHSTHRGAHTFNPSLGTSTSVLNVASINVTSGFINSIEGYHDAILSGPITVAGAAPVSRIAFTSIKPGGSISVGGDLQTLDIINDASFTTGPGLSVGRDLDWFELNGNLSFSNGANLTIGRDLSPMFQSAKGSGLAGQGLYVNGNFTVTAPSRVSIGRDLDFPGLLVNGNLSGASRFSVGGKVNGLINVIGSITA